MHRAACLIPLKLHKQSEHPIANPSSPPDPTSLGRGMQQSLLLVGLLAIFAQVYIVDHWNPNTSTEMAARQGLFNARKGDSSEGPYVVCPA